MTVQEAMDSVVEENRELRAEVQRLKAELVCAEHDRDCAYEMVTARQRIIDEMRRRYRLLVDQTVSADEFAALAGMHSVRVDEVIQ